LHLPHAKEEAGSSKDRGLVVKTGGSESRLEQYVFGIVYNVLMIMEVSESEVAFKELEGAHEEEIETEVQENLLLQSYHLGLGDRELLTRREKLQHQVYGGSQGLLHLGCHYQGGHNIE